MSDEWGPWIEHDGRTWPPAPIGTIVHRVFNKAPLAGIAKGQIEHVDLLTANERGSWIGCSESRQVIRYRIRKPRGMVICERLLADLPEQVDA